MLPRDRARLLAIRATEEALERYPERTVAMVRARLEKSLSRRDSERRDARAAFAWLTVRAIDVHPVVAERLVRLWLRRARQQVEREREELRRRL